MYDYNFYEQMDSLMVNLLVDLAINMVRVLYATVRYVLMQPIRLVEYIWYCIQMQRMNIKCCHCGDYTPFITEENIEIIPQVNLTRTDMDCLGDIAEALRECGCLGTCDFLRRVQSEVTKIVEYQEER